MNFISLGMNKYKEATTIMVTFYKNIENILQDILKKRSDWSNFKPEKNTKVKSTRYWNEYPVINAYIPGTINNEMVSIFIGINWYQSETNYPFYYISFYNYNKLNSKIANYNLKDKFEVTLEGDGLRFYPDSEDFNLERDFNILIDEFISCALL